MSKATSVDKVEAQADAVVTETQAAPVEVKAVEGPVIAPADAKQVSIESLAGEIGTLSGFVGLEQAMTMSFGKHTGEAVVTGKDEPKLLVTAENVLYIKGALASKPSLKGLFAETVLKLVADGMATDEYQADLARYNELVEMADTAREELEDAMRRFALPFDAEAFVNMMNVESAEPGKATAASTSNGGRAKSRAGAWDNPPFSHVYNGETFTLDNGAYEKGGRTYAWAVINPAGAVVGWGDTPTRADCDWLERTNRSTAVNSRKRWGVSATNS